MPGILLVCESNIFGEKMRKHKVCGPWNQGLKGSGNGNCLCIMFHIAISHATGYLLQTRLHVIRIPKYQEIKQDFFARLH